MLPGSASICPLPMLSIQNTDMPTIIMVYVLPGRAGICPLLLLSIQYTDMPTYHHGLRAARQGRYLPAATVEYPIH